MRLENSPYPQFSSVTFLMVHFLFSVFGFLSFCRDGQSFTIPNYLQVRT